MIRTRLKSHPLVTLLFVAGFLSGCRGSQGIDTVILVSIDSLRADRIGAYGHSEPTTPTIDSLAERGTVFERAYSTTSWTLPSHAALLTGQYNEVHGAKDHKARISGAVPLLAEELKKNGISTAGFYSGPYVAPDYGFGRGFDQYVDATSYQWNGPESDQPFPNSEAHKDITNPNLTKLIGDWIESSPVAERQFLFLHMWDVHYDFIAPEEYVDIFDSDYEGPVTGNFLFNPAHNPDMSDRDLQRLLALYDAEIRYTDETLGQILHALREAGRLNRSAIIVTADHGEEFFDHGQKAHRLTLHEEVIRVPLVLHVSGGVRQTPRSESVVSIVDVFPTVCDLFAVDCEYDGPGRSLLSEAGLRPEPGGNTRSDFVFAELTTRLFNIDQDAIVGDRIKLVRNHAEKKTTYYELDGGRPESDGVDVDEKSPDGQPAVVRELLERLDTHTKNAEKKGANLRTKKDVDVELSPEREQHLRALGYLD